MNIWRALKDRSLEKFILALTLTGVLYLYAVYRDIIIEQMRYLITAGGENFGVSLNSLMQEYMNNVFPIIMFWLLLGILCYFFYFVLQNTYYHLENAATVKLFFTKPIFLRQDNDKMFFWKRVLIHLIVIVSFILLAIITVFGLIPIAALLQKTVESVSISTTFVIISILISVVYWYLIETLIHVMAVRLNGTLLSTELEAEHKVS